MVDERLAPLGYRLLQALNVSEVDLERVRRNDFLSVLLRRNICSGATMAFRAERRPRMLPIAEGAYHDEWLALMAAAFGELAFCSEPLIRYRQHAANLLGARPESAVERIRKALHPKRRKEDLRRLKVLKQFHEQVFALGASAEVLGEVRGKLEHLRTRTSLPSARLDRLQPVIHELASGRYTKYSSWRGAVRDLFGPEW